MGRSRHSATRKLDQGNQDGARQPKIQSESGRVLSAGLLLDLAEFGPDWWITELLTAVPAPSSTRCHRRGAQTPARSPHGDDIRQIGPGRGVILRSARRVSSGPARRDLAGGVASVPAHARVILWAAPHPFRPTRRVVLAVGAASDRAHARRDLAVGAASVQAPARVIVAAHANGPAATQVSTSDFRVRPGICGPGHRRS
jgi:hypothetical protein